VRKHGRCYRKIYRSLRPYTCAAYQHAILGIRWHDFVRNTEVLDATNLSCYQDNYRLQRILLDIGGYHHQKAELFGHAVRSRTSSPHIITRRDSTNWLFLEPRLASAPMQVLVYTADRRQYTVHPSASVPNGLWLAAVDTPV